MNTFGFFAFFAALALANAGVLVPTSSVVQGASTRTTVVGPDGSSISSVSPGGAVVSEQVAHAPVVAYSAPVAYAGASPVVSAYSSPLVSTYASNAAVLHGYSAPVVTSYSSPVVSGYSSPVVSGYSSPVVSAYSSPLVSGYAVSAPVVSTYSAATPVVAPVAAVSHGVVSQKSVDTVIQGPSGTISTTKTVNTPTVVTHGVY